MTNKKMLVLAGNFAGLTAGLSVKHELGRDVDVTVVSKSDHFQFNPSLIWVPFGKRKVKDVALVFGTGARYHHYTPHSQPGDMYVQPGDMYGHPADMY